MNAQAPGFLYILFNPSMPGLIKVGRTTRDPSARAKELSAVSGVPTSFLLVYQQAVSDCHAAEKWVHSELERRGYRPNADREFFMAPVHEVVEVIQQAQTVVCLDGPNTGTAIEKSVDEDRGALAEQLYALGMEHFEGNDRVLRNREKALSLFEQASGLGHAHSSLMAGTCYMQVKVSTPRDIEKAFMYHQRAVTQGCWESHASLASIFLYNEQPAAAERHWRLLFDSAISKINEGKQPECLQTVVRVMSYCGTEYCLRASKGGMRAVVPAESLAVFARFMIQYHEQAIASAADATSRSAYQFSLNWLRSQIASLSTDEQ